MFMEKTGVMWPWGGQPGCFGALCRGALEEATEHTLISGASAGGRGHLAQYRHSRTSRSQTAENVASQTWKPT